MKAGDPLFEQAVAAIDAGDTAQLRQLLAAHPQLVTERAINNEEGYFKDPYLIWFVADNPIRIPRLPDNIVEVTRLLIDAMTQEAPDVFQEQITYTLGLVATGRIPRECGVQIPLMDALIDAGAVPGGGVGAIAHGNLEAANHLIDRGGKLTLPVAICLDRKADIAKLLPAATPDEQLTALTAAAFYGRADVVAQLLDRGISPNGYPAQNSGFHSHATPLHQAVWSGSLAVVQLLVNAGADLAATDKVYHGTPLGWALYAPSEITDEMERSKYVRIADYLRQAGER